MSNGTDPLIQASVDYRIALTTILIPLGTIGNVMVLIILNRKTFAKNTHSIFLRCLAVNDILILYTCLLPDTVTRAMHDIHYDRSDFACKANWYVMIVLTNISSWLLVVLSVERVISVWLPFKAKQLFTKRTAVIAVVTLSVTLVLFNVILVMHRFHWHDGFCDTGKGLWPWINSVVYSFGPGLTMIVCSTLVIVKLWILPTTGKGRKISGNVLMMLLLNVSFLGCTSPVVLVFAATDLGDRLGQGDGQAYMIAAVVNMLFYSSSAINFLLYALSGPQFRREFLNMIGKGDNRVVPTGSRSDTGDKSTIAP